MTVPALKVSAETKHDVAISFLAKDESIATQLKERLSDFFNVFFFPHNQEDLAGTNGMETMREPFLHARVVVVLYRDPWGKTPWTGVEQTAITDRCLDQGWDGLVFVQLDKASVVPKWLPKTHVRFNYDDYGFEELIGVIKARVQEQGGELAPIDAMTRAMRVQREAQFIAERQAMIQDRGWIESVVHASIRETIVELGRLAAEANKSHGFQIEHVAHQSMKSCVLRSGYVSMGISWHQPIFNRVEDYMRDKCHLRVVEYSGHVVVPGEGRWTLHDPKLLKEHQFQVDVSEARELVWKPRGKEEHIAPGLMADRIMQLFLDLIARANRGRVEPPPM